MKKNLVTILCVLSVVGLSACTPKDPTTTTETPNETTVGEASGGVLTGKAKGYGGDVTVKVTMDGDKIIDLTVEGPDETDGIGSNALDQLPDLIKAAGNTEVDAISGATVTSDAIIAAINNAIDPKAFPYGEETVAEAYERKEIAMADDSLKTGFGSFIVVDQSTDAGAEEGVAVTNAVLAAVTVDNKGLITDCVIDSIDTEIKFTAEGTVTADAAASLSSKNGNADADWVTFTNTVREAVIGKDLAEVKAITADETNGDALKAVISATETAKSYGAKAGDKLNLEIITEIVPRDFSSEKEGQIQASSTIAVVTVDDTEKVSSCILDAFQANVNFGSDGVISNDIKAPVKTKSTLGDDYGMRKSSGIKREWIEQAFALADYATGKDLDAITGISIDADGKPTDADVISSVTIGIDSFQAALISAIEGAK